MVGKCLAHFRIEKLLGKGGMGEVYQATDVTLDRQVALKVLRHEVASDAEYRDRFVREARAQARLNHPNICHIYFIGEQDQQLFFAMELIEGESLQERLDRQGKLPAAEAIELTRMAALGLREAHRHGFTHRDIKPSNLLIDRHGVLKLVDFGIVQARGTEDQAVVGTPLYMSPEQARGDEVDLRADMYSLGVTLHHLIAGQPPFVAKTPRELLSMHETKLRPRIAPQTRGPTKGLLDAICDRMMAKRAADRHASYDELIDVLVRLSPAVTRAAGFWVRAFAMMLDGLVWGLAIGPLDAVLEHMHKTLPYQLTLGVGMAYWVICIGLWGKTLGKRIMEIEVVPSGAPGRVGIPRALLRFGVAFGLSLIGVIIFHNTNREIAQVILGFCIFLPPFLMGAIPMFFVSQRTVWDRLSDTRVVYRRIT
jgi:tRNA A-37 threonylcarbamoyl transferase component Bud32